MKNKEFFQDDPYLASVAANLLDEDVVSEDDHIVEIQYAQFINLEELGFNLD